jgi:glycosyltransferase involved in cell wall biosynthesis
LEKGPFISIIVPTFNRCAYLTETVKSILRQTYTHFELLIVSDYSSDQTPDILEEIRDERCHLYKLEAKSNGPAHVRNYGIRRARGSLIAFCDDDDLWMPVKLEKQVRFLEKRPDIAILATNIDYFSDQGPAGYAFGNLKNLLNSLPGISPKYLLAFYNCITVSSCIIRKEALDKTGLFNEDDDYQGHEDLELWARICVSHAAHVIPERLVRYRVHSGQLSTASDKNYKKQSLQAFRKRYSTLNLLQKCIFRVRLLIYHASGR